MLNHIFHFTIIVCCSMFLGCGPAVSAEQNNSIHLNQLTVSDKDFHQEEIEILLDDVVLSSFTLFYLEDSYKKQIIERRVEVAAPAHVDNVAGVDERGMLGLNELIEIALAKNRLLEVVKQQQAQSRGQLTQARSGYLPQLSMEGRYSYVEREESAGTGNDISESELSANLEQMEKDDVVHGAVNFSQLIYDFGKTTGAIEAGKTNLLAANAKLHRQIQDVIYQVKSAYYNILEKRRLIDVAKESVNSFQEHLARADLYRRAGVRTKIDVINAEVELSNAKMLLVGAEYGLKTAKVALEQILGVQPHGGEYVIYQDEIGLDNILETMPPIPENLESLIDNAMSSRPDIIQLTLLTRSAEANLKASKGDYWPSIGAQANYNNYDTELSLYKDSWEVGMVASWDLFSGLQTKGAVAEALGRVLENKAQLQNLQLAVVREVTESYLQASENKERVKIALKTLELARENLALAEKRYESGANDVIEYNDAQLSLTRTRNDLVVTYYGYLTALAGIEYASGRLLH
ncbi:TolC family protein [Desulforhopalus sp. IMCC35007]|uniref:TolC family protein n=1 Tax=Desulforhopalus sp. IMCC35007 TaxID=2569543 RepID=UPI0010AE57F5|nr:TolC family protein [Desulforhopalus sp. IMCC35007]TKB07247.1 TolC family protein [Desulforhopalus sp. IMCC35007]